MRELEFHNGRIGEVPDVIPWCPSCDCYAVPNDAGQCGDCGASIKYKPDR
jgi:hypothetical protein